MLNSEKIAIAAHLHVLLRRKTGRVTDTEWMASNADYAAEIIRFSRASAHSDGHLDLGEWADKLAATMTEAAPARPIVSRMLGGTAGASQGMGQTPTVPQTNIATDEASAHRYVRGIR
jgi:hypothetical protein